MPHPSTNTTHIANNPFIHRRQPAPRMVSIYEYTASIIDDRLLSIVKGLCPHLYDPADIDDLIHEYYDRPYHHSLVLRDEDTQLQFLLDISPEALWNMCVSFSANNDTNYIFKVHGPFNEYLLSSDGQRCSDLIWDAVINNMWDDANTLSDTFIAAMLHYTLAYKLHVYHKHPKDIQREFAESQPIRI